MCAMSKIVSLGSITQMRISGYERKNRNVLRRCLNTTSDGAVTWYGRPFHVYAPETGKARVLTIQRRTTGGTDGRQKTLAVVLTAHRSDE